MRRKSWRQESLAKKEASRYSRKEAIRTSDKVAVAGMKNWKKYEAVTDSEPQQEVPKHGCTLESPGEFFKLLLPRSHPRPRKLASGFCKDYWVIPRCPQAYELLWWEECWRSGLEEEESFSFDNVNLRCCVDLNLK